MAVELVPWSAEDLSIARRFLGDPQMMVHLGGPQMDDEIAAAHERWMHAAANGGGMYKVVFEAQVVGTIGFWRKDWHGEAIYETGWSVFPEHQGRGFALEATRAIIEEARAAGGPRRLHAFPHVGNEASNAICRKAGFTLVGAVEFEYPPGNFDPSNDWVLDLDAT